MTRRGDLQEVELLDGDDPPAVEPPARRRFPTAAVVGAALVLVVGLVVTQWVLTARERAAVAALAQVPGVLAPVDETLVIERRVSTEEASALFGQAWGALERGSDGAQTYTWVDGTGGPGWSAELLGPNAALAGVAAPSVVTGSECVEDVAPSASPTTATRVVCLVSDGALVVDAAGGGNLVRVPATTREVVVLSTTDGSVLARWPVAAGENLAVLPDDVVVLASGSAADTTITGYDVLTGEQRWTEAEPLPGGFTFDDDDLLAVSLSRAGDLLAYASPGRDLRLLSSDGLPVRDLDGDLAGMLDAGWMTDHDGRILLESRDSASPRTTLIALDGDPADDVTVDGYVIRTAVDDGSVPGMLLTTEGGVSAWDERTGATRWSSDAVANPRSALVVRGRVFLATSRKIVALDGSTGATLWSTTAEAEMTVDGIFTDAHHLLATLEPTRPDGEPVLVAFEPASGHEDFRAPYPEGVSVVVPAGRTLIGLIEASNEFAVLG